MTGSDGGSHARSTGSIPALLAGWELDSARGGGESSADRLNFHTINTTVTIADTNKNVVLRCTGLVYLHNEGMKRGMRVSSLALA
jgi:hypothetical protein